MPVNGTLIAGPEAGFPPRLVAPRHRDGELSQLVERAAVPANFALNDVIRLGRLDYNATVLRTSRLFFDAALGAGRLLDIGTVDAPACLASNIDASVAAGAIGVPLINRPLTEHGKALWELAGFASPPGRAADLIVTLKGGAGPGAAWNLAAEIVRA
jgi:hypothetical protein